MKFPNVTRMRWQTVVRVLSLMVFAASGICKEVDLGELAKDYINTKIGPDNVESYGLTAEYSYWTGCDERKSKHPITARVTNFSYGKPEHPDLTFRSTVCRDKFSWIFDNFIWSPCVIPVDHVIYGMHNGVPTLLPVQLHLHNRTSIVWEPQKLNMKDGPVTITIVKAEWKKKIM
ncbi:uncharacterized protein LOC142577833 isoform X2 [Dermacentor variabilis]|uniref:uncharacterized protein LOC142577833 isoform X2 n=1 Tax=Dermacentor variabilis TaxID=34621 RepID=UPI003F5BF394